MPKPAILRTSERIKIWTKMRRSLIRFNATEAQHVLPGALSITRGARIEAFAHTRGAEPRERRRVTPTPPPPYQAMAERVIPALHLAWRYTRHRAIGSQP